MSTLIHSTATADMLSLATSGRQLSKFEKTAENAASDGFVSNFRGQPLRLTQPLVGFLFRQR